jgi:iron complex outermembrane receptor protein
MKKYFVLFSLICTVSNLLIAQGFDTLQVNEIVITSTQTSRNIEDIPAQINVIDSESIEEFPASNIDDILKTTANVYVNRSWGIFSKNSSVTMRGLESSSRTLVMIDGVPKNKISGGSVNWHNINPDNIDRIEIIKGPASALYGNNAMGGVINIITKKPDEKFEGSVKGYYGSYNTYGASLNAGGKTGKEEKGFFWDINGHYRRGDGYIFEDPEFIDPTDVKTYLHEQGLGTKFGYLFNNSDVLDISYEYFDEKRGAGRKVYLEDGSFESYLTNSIRAIYTGKIKQADIKALAYYTAEDYWGQKESLNSSEEYKLLDSYTDKTDYGMWLSYTNTFLGNKITVGAEYKSGDVLGEEIYRTSPDYIHYGSKMNILGFFIQDEISLIQNKLNIIAGIRNDIVQFFNGFQTIMNPTKVTGFLEGFNENFDSNNWNALSPKIALHYKFQRSANIYASYSVGFVPPKLKDLSQTGKINKGFRLANPNLKPEYLTNYEIGYSQLFLNRLKINAAVYYSIGKDFQYLIGTGDSIDTGGSSLKPVLNSDNIAEISITGAELSVQYIILKNLNLNMSYSYNYSVVSDFDVSDINSSVDLSGLYLSEVSPHLIYAGASWKNKLFHLNLNCNYTDEQFWDVENTVVVEDYFVANMKLSKTFKKRYHFYIDVQNILDNQFVDRKGRLSPGRFIIGGFKFIL